MNSNNQKEQTANNYKLFILEFLEEHERKKTAGSCFLFMQKRPFLLLFYVDRSKNRHTFIVCWLWRNLSNISDLITIGSIRTGPTYVLESPRNPESEL
jgi:hypothetical protein